MGDTTTDAGGERAARRGDLLLVAGHGRLVTYVLDKKELVIGRDPACDVVIDHAAFSRRHARLRLGPPVTIEDLGSKNGVRISGALAHEGIPVALEPGDVFHIGGFSFTIVGHADAQNSSTGRSGSDRLRVEDPTLPGVSPFIHDVARSGTSVLVLGESGCGKDVLAETLHALSGRHGELARVNCAALAEPLIESELFGHEKGAFTGATSAKVGLLESAQGGTVFLDEVGELSLGTQAKLLRALESREVLRIGSIRPVKIDVRFLAATNRDLPRAVATKAFRHDLYFRLDGITLMIPPLRERRSRIPELAARFLDGAAVEPDVIAALQAYDWPGNVRELKAVLDRARLLSRGKPIGVRHLAFTPRVDDTPRSPAPEIVDEALAMLTPEEQQQRRELVQVLERFSGNQTRAAKALGISRTTLVSRIKVLRVPRPRS